MLFSKKRTTIKKDVNEFIKELNKLKKEKLNENSIAKLNEILREFLKKKYGFKYGLTPQELLKELKKKRIDKKTKLDTAEIILEIYKEEYSPENPITRKQFIKFLNQTKKIIKSAN